MNLGSTVQKPDDRDGKGFSKENVQLEQRYKGEVFPTDAFQQMNSLGYLGALRKGNTHNCF